MHFNMLYKSFHKTHKNSLFRVKYSKNIVGSFIKYMFNTIICCANILHWKQSRVHQITYFPTPPFPNPHKPPLVCPPSWWPWLGTTADPHCIWPPPVPLGQSPHNSPQTACHHRNPWWHRIVNINLIFSLYTINYTLSRLDCQQVTPQIFLIWICYDMNYQ